MKGSPFPWQALNGIPREVLREAEERPPLHHRLILAGRHGLAKAGATFDWSQDHPVLGRAHRLAHRLYWKLQ